MYLTYLALSSDVRHLLDSHFIIIIIIRNSADEILDVRPRITPFSSFVIILLSVERNIIVALALAAPFALDSRSTNGRKTSGSKLFRMVDLLSAQFAQNLGSLVRQTPQLPRPSHQWREL